TAEAVQVIGELTIDGEVVAAGEQFIDFLSGGETEEIVFIFDRAAPEAETSLRVASYKSP
ncbi:MAG: TIGR02588 family protein, partial [Acidimicrobiia bacterium]|nr:TIGR02588 family protein [Acidimicrobiia bacterium]